MSAKDLEDAAHVIEQCDEARARIAAAGHNIVAAALGIQTQKFLILIERTSFPMKYAMELMEYARALDHLADTLEPAGDSPTIAPSSQESTNPRETP